MTDAYLETLIVLNTGVLEGTFVGVLVTTPVGVLVTPPVGVLVTPPVGVFDAPGTGVLEATLVLVGAVIGVLVLGPAVLVHRGVIVGGSALRDGPLFFAVGGGLVGGAFVLAIGTLVATAAGLALGVLACAGARGGIIQRVTSA